jgi:hypothetical protein
MDDCQLSPIVCETAITTEVQSQHNRNGRRDSAATHSPTTTTIPTVSGSALQI